MSQKFKTFYNKNYKKLLVLPVIVLTLSLIYICFFYLQTGDIIKKDVSLTGGTTITLFSGIPSTELESELSKSFNDISIRTLSDNSGKQTEIIITVQEEQTKAVETALEGYLGYKLTEENSSIETTSSSLSEDFYKQLVVAVLLAFFWMAAVVFVIFAKGKKIKFLVILLNILFGLFLGGLFLKINPYVSWIIFFVFASVFTYIYIKNSVPSFAVMLSAFSDIVMTLALVDLIGMKISTAGIVAFLMLIGYSVDTDILLTTRVLKRKKEASEEIWGAFKTGTTMTLTSIVAVATALVVVYPFASVLNQIFIILLIGLGFDLFNTWVTNASIIKWSSEER